MTGVACKESPGQGEPSVAALTHIAGSRQYNFCCSNACHWTTTWLQERMEFLKGDLMHLFDDQGVDEAQYAATSSTARASAAQCLWQQCQQKLAQGDVDMWQQQHEPKCRSDS